jgi:hypothetical protein
VTGASDYRPAWELHHACGPATSGPPPSCAHRPTA